MLGCYAILPLLIHMTSFTNPKVRNVVRGAEIMYRIVCEVWTWFLRFASGQTYRHAHAICCTPTGVEIIMISFLMYSFFVILLHVC